MGDPLYPWDRKQESQQDEREAPSDEAEVLSALVDQIVGRFSVAMESAYCPGSDANRQARSKFHESVETLRRTLTIALHARAAQQVQADAGAVAYIPDDALARLTPPLLVLDGVRLYRYNGIGTTALYLRPAAESDKRDVLTEDMRLDLAAISEAIAHGEPEKAQALIREVLTIDRAAMSREQGEYK